MNINFKAQVFHKFRITTLTWIMHVSDLINYDYSLKICKCILYCNQQIRVPFMAHSQLGVPKIKWIWN